MKKFDRFFAGQETGAYRLFGSHPFREGVRFTVYAPCAHRVALISSFDDWKAEYHLEKIDERGVWSLYISRIKPIYSYRYRIYKNDYECHERIDPYAYYFERRPANASCMVDLSHYRFQDSAWRRKKNTEAISIYELHLNAFMKGEELSSYQQLQERLIPYLLENGFTHVEVMPVFEHPLDASWGYQASGFYGVTSRYGTVYDFMKFVDSCHRHNIGVYLDVVYAHFVADEFALAKFDFSPLYEYEEPHLEKSEWGTYYFALHKGPVISFLMSSAFFYIEKYHIDGLRYDAVSHLLYHHGNRNEGENLEGISFMKRLNYALKKEFPKVKIMAEDSSDYGGVTRPVEEGGLGFDYKWDLGWMNDTLRYYGTDFYFRSSVHNLMTFSMYYFYSEKFLLPLSHDEVVHAKGTIINKMFGTYEQKFQGCRNLFVYMFTHPGKKLNFMGNELAQFREFDEKRELDWSLLEYPYHQKFSRFFRDINRLYSAHPALHQEDYDYRSFRWIDCDNRQQEVYSYVREYENDKLIVILNMKDVAYHDYAIGVPFAGYYEEIFNSEWDIYGGGMLKQGILASVKENRHMQSQSIHFSLAPLAALVFRYQGSR